MTIRQFNGSYFLNEDRILFRFNTQNQEEYRFWLTRRTTLFIIAAVSHLFANKLELSHSPDAAKALNEFEKECILDFAKREEASAQEYKAGLNFPLGFDPILVMDVTCSLIKNSEKLTHITDKKDGQIDENLSIDFMLPGGANINIRLAGNNLLTMCILLDQLRQQAGWGEAVLRTKGHDGPDDQSLRAQTTMNTSIH